MGDRGRTSGSELETIKHSALTTIERPMPIPELTPEQADIWLDITGNLPADWFPLETHQMLAQYCRHVISARRVASLIQQYEAGEKDMPVEDYDRLLKMQEREGRALSSLATRMRITQQATYDPKRKKSNPEKKPWE